MKLFLAFTKRLYLIRWINSALCFLSVLAGIFITAYAVYYEQLSALFLLPFSYLWWLLIIPGLYLATEISLLKIYCLATELEKGNRIPYAEINKRKLIIFEHEAGLPERYNLTMIGNPNCFFDPQINFLEAKTLIKSRALGIILGLLALALILLNIFLKNGALIGNFAIIIAMMILVIKKVFIEDLPH